MHDCVITLFFYHSIPIKLFSAIETLLHTFMIYLHIGRAKQYFQCNDDYLTLSHTPPPQSVLLEVQQHLQVMTEVGMERQKLEGKLK